MTKGETLTLTVKDADAAAVEFRFGGPQTRTVVAVKDGESFNLSVSTATWAAGIYRYQAWATYADATVKIIETATVDLKDVLGISDQRTPARKMVEMIETMMAGNAGEGVRRYKINNRELERYSVAELMQLLSYWRERMKREERRDAGVSELGRRIAVRF